MATYRRAYGPRGAVIPVRSYRPRRRGGRGRRNRGTPVEYMIGAAVGYLKPVQLHPLQDVVITALAVSPVKILPWKLFQGAKGYTLGMCVRAVAPNALGTINVSSGGNDGGFV